MWHINEGPYIFARAESSPSFGERSSFPTDADEIARRERRSALNTIANEGSVKLEDTRYATRQDLTSWRCAEVSDARRHRLSSDEERINRWSVKKSPFQQDLWKADEKLYAQNRYKDNVVAKQVRLEQKGVVEARTAIRRRAVSEVDELQHLRTEKRLLTNNAAKLRALSDLSKVNDRVRKASENKEAHERHQASRPELQRMTSDFSTAKFVGPKARAELHRQSRTQLLASRAKESESEWRDGDGDYYSSYSQAAENPYGWSGGGAGASPYETM